MSTASTPAGALGSRRNPINVQSSSGIPEGIRHYVINLPFNDFERLEETVEARWHELAAIMVEPMMGNAAAVMARPGWLEKMRELCDRYGIVLIFDEVKTGFRIANGRAQEYFGVQADLVTYAKAMGNGFPVAAIGGKADVMGVIGPGQVAHGATYTGYAVGAAAADATLEILETEPIIETMFQRGQQLLDGIHEILGRADIPYFVTGLPPMFSFILWGRFTADVEDTVREGLDDRRIQVLQCGSAVRAVTGWDVSLWELMKVGERRLNMLRAFNAREGVGAEADTVLPKLPVPLQGGAGDGIAVTAEEAEAAKALYYEMAGWDESGRPTRTNLEGLALAWVADEIGL